jgi:beta-lactamase superfamily II metal-dependent hydrolase
MLIDAGRQDGDEVVPHFWDLGVPRIDLVAIIHPHSDHIGQLDDVLPDRGSDVLGRTSSRVTSRRTTGRSDDCSACP